MLLLDKVYQININTVDVLHTLSLKADTALQGERVNKLNVFAFLRAFESLWRK